jgi:hypothetical protein
VKAEILKKPDNFETGQDEDGSRVDKTADSLVVDKWAAKPTCAEWLKCVISIVLDFVFEG